MRRRRGCRKGAPAGRGQQRQPPGAATHRFALRLGRVGALGEREVKGDVGGRKVGVFERRCVGVLRRIRQVQVPAFFEFELE